MKLTSSVKTKNPIPKKSKHQEWLVAVWPERVLPDEAKNIASEMKKFAEKKELKIKRFHYANGIIAAYFTAKKRLPKNILWRSAKHKKNELRIGYVKVTKEQGVSNASQS